MNHTSAVAALLLTCALLPVGCGGRSPAPPARDEGRLARDAAEDFLIVAGPHNSLLVEQGTQQFTTKNFRHGGGRLWYEFKSFSITSQTMNPSQTEATVRGSVQATRRWEVGGREKEFTGPVGFRLRLVKGQPGWQVDEIEFGAAPAEAKP